MFDDPARLGMAMAHRSTSKTHVPALLYSLLRRGFTTRRAVCEVGGGLMTAVVLVAFSPVLSGSPDALYPDAHLRWFPLQNPGRCRCRRDSSRAGWAPALSREPAEPTPIRHAETEVRSLTGAGAV